MKNSYKLEKKIAVPYRRPGDDPLTDYWLEVYQDYYGWLHNKLSEGVLKSSVE